MMNHSSPAATGSPPASPSSPLGSQARAAGPVTARDEKRPDTGWRRDHGRSAIHRMCLARRADKIEARDANLPVVIAYREAQARKQAAAWWSAFACLWSRIGVVAACAEVA